MNRYALRCTIVSRESVRVCGCSTSHGVLERDLPELIQVCSHLFAPTLAALERSKTVDGVHLYQVGVDNDRDSEGCWTSNSK
jgi:hypothetical protein